MVKAEWFRPCKSVAAFLLFSSALVYVGLLSMLIAEVWQSPWHLLPKGEGFRWGHGVLSLSFWSRSFPPSWGHG